VTDRVGVELLSDRLRAVALGRFGAAPRATLEIAWDPDRPADAIASLSARFGRPRRLALAIGLGFLHVARVTLPPLRAADRRRALALDPSRHFPVDEPVTVALLGDAPVTPAKVGANAPNDGEPAFALPRARLGAWLDAFGAWAPVECVEAAPTSLARALAAEPPTDATYALAAGAEEVGSVQIRGGRVVGVRRVPELLLDDVSLAALPARPGVGSEYLVAWGAALGTDQPADVQLLDDGAARAVGARRVRRATTAAVACGAALGLALVALDRARERRLDRLDAEIAALAPRAAPAESLLARAATVDAAGRGADQLASRRASALRVLDALGERLPSDAVVQSLRLQGDAWEVDGTARAAAGIVPALDADPRFADVRAVAPSSRMEGPGPARETFAVSFRARSAP